MVNMKDINYDNLSISDDHSLDLRIFKSEDKINRDLVMHGDPFWNYIIKYLSPLDMFNLTEVDSFYENNISENFYLESIILCINKRLKQLFDNNYDDVIKLLDEHQAVISGSFIIQCILNENWNTDIDIYVPASESKDVGYTTTITMFEMLLSKLVIYENFYNASQYGNDVTNKIIWIREYSFSKTKTSFSNPLQWIGIGHDSYLRDKEKPKIQTIDVSIEADDMYELIKNSFDFDICKNVYGVRNGKQYVNIYSLKEILSKTTKLKFCDNPGSSMNRYEKYKKRGFKFQNDQDKKSIYEDIMSKSRYYYVFYVKPVTKSDYFIFNSKYGGFTFKVKLINTNVNIDKIKETFQYESRDAQGYVTLVDDILVGRTQDKQNELCGKTRPCPIKFCYGESKKHFHLQPRSLHCDQPDYIFLLNE